MGLGDAGGSHAVQISSVSGLGPQARPGRALLQTSPAGARVPAAARAVESGQGPGAAAVAAGHGTQG
eukprot:CAMPEP_0173237370 /NCGR_PEP_ID=MMETSP1142-20121109/12016_1 /TAXON_ID=483371 /ORGANISM="non described non described, Strain CCMP2298" /LENGTH=66 /DNA_ID=CAMNT_0014168059 /DNA_START=455 /DNA_END=652 /DNA_ORIENTATION=-